MIKRFWTWLTSYPMTRIDYAFTDAVSGRSVYYFLDQHGRRWMAEHRFSTFRVPAWERNTP